MPWKRHVSPAHRRVQDTHRGKLSVLYRFDIHRANCSSGCRGPVPSVPPDPVEFSVPVRAAPAGYKLDTITTGIILSAHDLKPMTCYRWYSSPSQAYMLVIALCIKGK